MTRRALLASLLAGCLYSPAKGPARVDSVEPARNPGAPSLRLGWLMWTSASTVVFCHRRLDDDGNPVGVTGPCFKSSVDNPNPGRIVAFVSPGKPDPAPPNVAPPGCTIELEEAQLVPAPKPARAWLVSSTGKTLLEEWSPAREVNGDRFVLETSLSPDGKWLALARLAVGVGEGERSIEPASIVFKPVSSCR
jgi:hypothetical protein